MRDRLKNSSSVILETLITWFALSVVPSPSKMLHFCPIELMLFVIVYRFIIEQSHYTCLSLLNIKLDFGFNVQDACPDNNF